MKKILSSVLFCILIMHAYCQNINVFGIQSGVWDTDTVFVIGDVQIGENTALSIAPGTVVMFNGFYGIEVENASFSAIGTEDEPIRFTVADTTGLHLCDFGRGGWNGLSFSNCMNPIQLEHCIFEYGKAVMMDNMRGGAVRVFFCDSVAVSHCTFRYNVARERGAGLFGGHSNLYIHDCEVSNSLVYNNDGNIYVYGGGFNFLNSSVSMENMRFENNICTACAGGALGLDSCDLYLNNATFTGNYGAVGGGISVIRSNHRTVKMSNVLLYQNVSTMYAGALAIATTSPTIDNFTIVDNACQAAGGGGLQFYMGACPKFRNTIIWDNKWDNNPLHDGSQIWVWDYTCKPEFYYCVLDGGLEDVHNGDEIEVYEGMVETDPLFEDAENRNYQLTAGSPCRDMGMPDLTGIILPELDLAGNPRIVNDRIDMGVFEYFHLNVAEHANEQGFTVSPNPLSVNSVCTLELKKESSVSLKVYSLLGQVVWEKDFGRLSVGSHNLSLQPFVTAASPDKVYFVEIKTAEGTSCQKIVY